MEGYMDITKLILDSLRAKGEIKASDIIKKTGYSRAYIGRFFQKLREEGKILLIGKANKTRYILANEEALTKAKKQIVNITRILHNKDLKEDIVLGNIKKNTGIFMQINKNIRDIVNYAFLELLNNAIEHSRSKMIKISMKRDQEHMFFDILDRGVGIYNNIMKKKNLKTQLEAIQDLLKGKQTTAPEAHSGEGIFFTSKVADFLIIQGSQKKIIFNNLIEDIFIKNISTMKGTKVSFSISLKAKRDLGSIFKQYTDDSFKFSKTKVTVYLFKMDTQYISRSQARRIISGLDKFKTVVLDFKNVEMVGQGFADEIFRVWHLQHPRISISAINTNENTEFMIKRAKAEVEGTYI